MSIKTLVTVAVVAAAGWYAWRRWGSGLMGA